MSEITHDQIVERVDGMEHRFEARLDSMSAQIVRLEEKTDSAVEGVGKNREHFETEIKELRQSINDTHTQVVSHRSEFQGGVAVLKGGLATLGAIMTLGLTILGFVLSS